MHAGFHDVGWCVCVCVSACYCGGRGDGRGADWSEACGGGRLDIVLKLLTVAALGLRLQLVLQVP